MNSEIISTSQIKSAKPKFGAIRWLIRETCGNLILIGILFGVVGRWNWWMGWALSGIYIIWSATTAILILPVNPEMLAERSRPHADTKNWDKMILGVMGLLMIAEYVIASLDVHLSWSPQLPLYLQVIGLVMAIIGYDVLLVWAMVSNAFFVATVRIQKDRRQAVVSNGPYRFIRHPGYLGTLLLHWGVPLMLNSLWAFIPAGLITLVLVIRTFLEDKTLLAELPGYIEYAGRVRYRLFPGIW